MEKLKNLSCVPCRGGEPPVTRNRAKELQSQVPDWDVEEHNNVNRLVKIFKFKNFKEAMDFTSEVGRIAEEEGHHPIIVTQWGKVKISWWTHKIKGLHNNDFIMAAKTDELYMSQ